jgi:hypothetical protein
VDESSGGKDGLPYVIYEEGTDAFRERKVVLGGR